MIRKVKILVFAFVTTLSFTSMATELDPQSFCSDPIQALKTATQNNNKPILLYFTANWCPPCRATKATIAQNPQHLDNVNIVYVDITEEKNANPCFPLINRWGSQTIPFFIGGSIEKFEHLDRESKALSSRLDPQDKTLLPSYLEQFHENILPNTHITHQRGPLFQADDLKNITQSIQRSFQNEGINRH